MAGKNSKEAIYIQVPTPDGAVEFHDATEHLGRKLPFKNPKMVCGMSVNGTAVAFSLLMLTKKSASGYAAKDLSLPRPSLYRLARYAAENPLEDGEALVEYEGKTQKCKILIGESGIAELEPLDEDISLELPRGAARLTVLLKTPNLDRPIAVGFTGYPGKPGTPSSARRMAAMALYSLTLLAPFRLLTRIETFTVPAGPRAYAPQRSQVGEATAAIPIWLFADDGTGVPAAVAHGDVIASVDIDQANPTTGRPVVHLTPDEALAEHFEPYREKLSEIVGDALTEAIGSQEMRELTVSIVLGDISEGHVGMLNDALKSLSPGYDVSPSAHQKHQ